MAVMNQNPSSDFGPAPFLPPPPGKAGRRAEDRYAAFDSGPAPARPAPFLDTSQGGLLLLYFSIAQYFVCRVQ